MSRTESGEVFEWSIITENAKTTEDVEDTSNSKEDKETDQAPDTEVEEKEPTKVTRISEPQQLTQIDLKLKDIAISSTAYTAITDGGDMIIWGEYSTIYAVNTEKTEEKGKKKKKKPKDKEVEEESGAPSEPYIFIKSLTGNEEDSPDAAVDIKYQAIMSCSNNFVVLDCDGKVHSFGISDHGTLGLGEDVTESLQPMQVVFGEDDSHKTTSISSSGAGCIALDGDGAVWYWGKTFPPVQDDSPESEMVPTDADAADDKAETEQKEKELVVHAVPVQIKLETDTRIQQAVITDIGGFMWCS